MNFSSKIKEYYEGMQVYEHLLEDEKAIHIPFALSFTVTIATINGQLRAYLLDLENKVCQEIPDIDFDLMTNIYNIMSTKLKHDMLAFGNKTIRQILEELFGDQLDKTPAEMHEFIFNNTKLMTEYLKKIRVLLDSADPALFEGYVLRHIREHNWEDIEEDYLKWRKYTELTMDHLREKQEQVLEKYLERGIMRFAHTPSKSKMDKVDYTSHTDLLEFNFKDTVEYKMVYTQFMQFATRKDGMLIIDLKKYGKYIFDYYYRFAEGQKVALFELIVILDLIHKDMVELKPGRAEVKATPAGSADCFRFANDFVKATACDIVKQFYLGSAANLALIETAFYDHNLLLKRNSHRAFVKTLIAWGALPDISDDGIAKLANGMAYKMKALPNSGYEEWDRNNYGNDKKTCADIGMKLGTTMPYSRKSVQ